MIFKKIFIKIKKKISGFLARRPHRSFRLSRRRDYDRSLKIPGYIKFTKEVFGLIWANRKKFLVLGLIYVLVTYFLIGIMAESTYSAISEALNTINGDLQSEGVGELTKAGLLLLSVSTSGLSQLSEVQQILAIIAVLFMWLACVWMLRHILAGRKFKVRDALYSSGSPILATFLVLMLIVLQLLPVAIALFGYGAALATGLLLVGGVEAMMFWFAAALLATLSLYWISGSAFALIIVTLPGMYPYEAIKTASDLVVGRRLRFMLRLIWLLLMIVISWAVVIIPIIFFDSWIKGVFPAIEWLPIVPLAVLFAGTMTIIWSSSYIYLLYRKVITDESSPA